MMPCRYRLPLPQRRTKKLVKAETPKLSSKKNDGKPSEDGAAEKNSSAQKDKPNKKKKKRDSSDGKSVSTADESPKKKKKGGDADVNTKKDFLSSKKYTGAKKGYVFRNGSDGVGYYVDVKPVVDKMAMQALSRTSKNRQAPGSGGRKKGGGKRRGRRQSY
mmetsp:Transcript_13144/g.18913  ORF Transcript_13144/g.18913 Transcript_13144/m.18913 type:complete len:161 (-) Transcript_13144:101-583(-)